MKILKPTPQNIAKCSKVIQCGGLVAFPTETVYGLGANALNLKSVAKIFEVKQRPVFDPLIIHVANKKMLQGLVKSVNPAMTRLIDCFWPGPLTIVMEKSDIVPDLVTAGMSTVAVRMPKHPVALALIRKAKIPLAAPSANLFNRTSPTEALAVQDQLDGKIDYVLDGGKCKIGVESTIVLIQGKTLFILRPGAITSEMLKKVFSGRVTSTTSSLHNLQPGGLQKHYSPQTISILADKKLNITEAVLEKKILKLKKKPRLGLVCFGRIRSQKIWDKVITLSETKDLNEAAANLFSTMRRMDRMGLDVIVFQPVPEKSIGIAIMDRIRKACFGNKL